MENEGVSVVVTAYNVAEYIEECIDSIYRQTLFKKGQNWEVLIGIDHCEKTLDKIQSIKHKYPGIKIFYMPNNVGTYITTNTLISKSKYDKILRFDSDDIMKENMVENLVEAMQTVAESKIILCYYETFSLKKEDNPRKTWAHGVFLFKKSIYEKYGGFMPWRCGADTEFLTRLKDETPAITFPIALFYRRVHDDSLTRKKETSMQSEIRKKYKKYIKEISPTTPVIKTITTQCEEIGIEIPKQSNEIETCSEKIVLLPSPKIEEKIEEKQTIKRRKYVKQIASHKKIIKKISTGTYNGV